MQKNKNLSTVEVITPQIRTLDSRLRGNDDMIISLSLNVCHSREGGNPET